MEKILSRQNPRIKRVAKLVESSSFRHSSGLFVTEGVRLCLDAFLSGLSPLETYLTSAAFEKYSEKLQPLLDKSGAVFEISEEVSLRISDTKSPQGVFSVYKTLDNQHFWDKIIYEGIYVATDDIQNPANLGAICRTAEALGLHGLFIGGGCDIYNPKALRASMGSFFRLPVCTVDDLEELIPRLQKKGMKILSSVPDCHASPISSIEKKDGIVMVIGNEGNGISESIVAKSDLLVTIPMRGRAESLNAAAAASIIMWELVRE